jgi:nucleotide-binding universal stress UspA family protein
MFKKILVPLDGSALAETALLYARTLARMSDAEIVILRIPDHIEPRFPAQAYAESLREQKEAEADAQAYIEARVAKLHIDHFKGQGILREGPVAETILAAAEELRADTIVMSTHGWKGLQHLLNGSIAERVVRNAHIPVLVVHSN